MAAEAVSRGINAIFCAGGSHEIDQPPLDAVGVSDRPVGFIALLIPASSVLPEPSGEPVRIEVRRGWIAVAVTWPAGAAEACAAWMRELLR